MDKTEDITLGVMLVLFCVLIVTLVVVLISQELLANSVYKQCLSKNQGEVKCYSIVYGGNR